ALRVAASKGSPFLNEATGDVISVSDAMKQAEVHGKKSSAAKKQGEKSATLGLRLYHIRNWLLLAGFVLLVVSHVLQRIPQTQ
ncbi:MAG TPA: hypothetical protein VFS11_07775, partial [Gemmatimonadales bacterium]|nr:hypothetical protein [Gemmatimonadales bacterium]